MRRRSVEIGEGWVVSLPDDVSSTSEPDGTWVAWTPQWTLRVVLVSAGTGPEGGPPVPSALLQGDAPITRKPSGVLLHCSSPLEEEIEGQRVWTIQGRLACLGRMALVWAHFPDTRWCEQVEDHIRTMDNAFPSRWPICGSEEPATKAGT